MSIFGNEQFLPGVITEVEADYSFGYDTSLFGSTDSEVVIGTAFDGPVGKIVPVYNPEHGHYLFGKAYDSKTRQEATLVAGIRDAWDRGCRTIYAVRVGGVDLFKDFDFCVDINMRLRVSAANPSNIGKQAYMMYDATPGAETLKFYKPASRATIAEKMQGLVVSDNAVLVTELRLNQDYGIGSDSKLIDLVRLVNEHQYNNVLKLSIVDEYGVDITNSLQAFDVAIGALHPGVYFIGRAESECASYTDLKFRLIEDETSPKPYSDFDGLFYHQLDINTEVSASLPIYAANAAELRQILSLVNISTNKDYDFLEVSGLSDRAFPLDKKDHEEVNLSAFEIYKRLGCGFAATAFAERRVDGVGYEVTPRIKETPMDDTNRIVPIKDGIYGLLENANIKYRVLTCGAADEAITGKLPRPADFQVTSSEEIEILKGLVRASAKVDKKSKFASKAYKFKFETFNSAAVDKLDDVYTDSVLPVVAKVSDESSIKAKNIAHGTQLMLIDAGTEKGTLIRINSEGHEPLTGARLKDELVIVDGNIYKGVETAGVVEFVKEDTVAAAGGKGTYLGKEYVLGESCNEVFVFQVLDGVTIAGVTVEALGDLKTMMSENTDKTLIYAQSNYFETNPIIVKSAAYSSFTMEEFVLFLNEHEVLGRLFNFELTDDGALVKDSFVDEVATAGFGVESVLAEDRGIGYDYSLYIPYRTTDNFARQLAQHCTYTELKTAPTFGVIGCKRIIDVGLSSLATKIENVVNTEFDLYAKSDQGRNMLDRNNLPYPIGKNISVVFAQYFVTMDDGYRFISNGAAGYAGMVSTLPLDQSSTNQPIAIPLPMFSLTNYQLGRLTAKGIVTVKESFTRGSVITDGITMAPVASVFRRLSASRIVGAVEELIRQVAEPFIGKQNHSANRNSLQTAIKSNLDKLKGRLIEGYEFNMVVDPKVLKFNYIDIDYKIVPIYEIREIRNRISVKDQ